jgi:predicted nucleotidyltransferase component of viral defense system
MISLDEIKNSYPPKLQSFSLGILREYLQYKILESIYSSKFNTDLIFMGGTCLRIIHDNQRFSEDLDFDNIGLDRSGFENLAKIVEETLKLEGFPVETRLVYKKTFHCYIKIPKILNKEGLSSFPNQKITIRIDTTPQNYKYSPSVYLLDKFDVYQNIKVTPISILMSQKITALLRRKRAKGRDFFDVSSLISKGIKPDMKYLKQKLDIDSVGTLKTQLRERAEEVNLNKMADDVEAFLFNRSHVTRILDFDKHIEEI